MVGANNHPLNTTLSGIKQTLDEIISKASLMIKQSSLQNFEEIKQIALLSNNKQTMKKYSSNTDSFEYNLSSMNNGNFDQRHERKELNKLKEQLTELKYNNNKENQTMNFL